jgi:hypothetical protein
VDFPVWGKMAYRQYLESIGLPYYAVFCGLFAEWAEGFILGAEPEKNEARIVGKGDKKISFTALGDVAEFIAVTTTSESRSSLRQAFIPKIAATMLTRVPIPCSASDLQAVQRLRRYLWKR